MTLRGRIAIPEPLKIRIVKCEKLQNLPRSAGKYSREGPRVAMYRKAKMRTVTKAKIGEGRLEIP